MQIEFSFLYSKQLKNGRELVENSVKVVQSYLGADDPRMKYVKEIALECGDIALADRCEGSSAVYNCANDGALKRGFKLEEII